MLHILHVVGARPNFMKVAPVIKALTETGKFRQTLIHTGQHYNENMSDIFFAQLGIPAPDINLAVGSGSHAIQTAQIMTRFEEVVNSRQPDRVLVYGDVNSTVATALVCAKLFIPVDHVEAGLRSRDRTMPEEINRLVTDQLASLLFTPSQDGDENLLREGVEAKRIHFVGNVMIDTLVNMLPNLDSLRLYNRPLKYALVTLHRPSNVDDLITLTNIMHALTDISRAIPVIFPMHPRTRKRLDDFNIVFPKGNRFQVWEPIGYLEFLALQKDATLVITDSGGIQEETSYMQVPCLTLRENTERPVTVTYGTNILVGKNTKHLLEEVHKILNKEGKTGVIPPLWDGKASERIAKILVEQLL
ncbi:MAG: UDP-N-acetylglucosamine 2-epimerase (non-hydrolyzing) [Chloroflexi bacterium]|nr:UDP-N-acetylglucosamine 2-epimerase (non-hydrolyzing) [Chloroflexota bacterium]